MHLPSHEERIATIELELMRVLSQARKSDMPVYVERIRILNADLRRLKAELDEHRKRRKRIKE